MPTISIIYSFRDGKGAIATTEVQIPTSITLANATIFAQQLALLIDPIISGIITRIGIAVSVTLPGGLNVTPNAGSDVEEGALFSFVTANNFRKQLRIPTFNETQILSGTQAVNTADTDVAAFITAMTDGILLTGAGGTGTPTPVDTRAEDLTALDFARESFQSTRSVN